MSITRKCSLEYCDNKHYSKGYCRLHWWRARCGTPLDKMHAYQHRPAIIEGDIARIPVGVKAKDGYAIVDKEFATLDKYRWHADSNGYPTTNINGTTHRLHVVIVGKVEGMVVDHINRNILDNRRSNLRHVTKRGNQLNQKLSKHNKSGCKGVRLVRGRWVSVITVRGARYRLGSYGDVKDAIAARKKAEIELNYIGDDL